MPKPVNVTKSRAVRFADLARDYADNTGRIDFNNMNCWQAAFEVGRRSGAISSRGVHQLLSQAQPQNPAALIAGGDKIATAAQFRRVPPGNIIIFSGPGYHGSGRRLVHVMVSLGEGSAAGSNNTAIRESPQWSKVDIASKWSGGGVEGCEVAVRDLTDISRPHCFVQ